MSEIQYDPACVRCRIDAGKDAAGTTWQCVGHIIAERDALRSALAAAERETTAALAWFKDAEERLAAAVKERDEARAEQNASKRRLAAMVDLAEKRGAAYDSANEQIADLQRTVRTVFALIADWRDGNARLGRPRSFVDQRFVDALAGVKTDQITEVKLIVEGQRGGTATFMHWSGAATKPEER